MGKIIAIASGKGGTGKSTVTAAVSRVLARIGCRVLAVDLDSGLRSLDLLFGAEDRLALDLEDILRDARPPADAVVQLNETLFLLSAPGVTGRQPPPERVIPLLRRIKSDYDYILLDLPAGTEYSVTLAKALADLVLLVATPDQITCRDARNMADALLAEKQLPCRMIINKVGRSSMIAGGFSDLDAMIDRVGIPLFGVIPDDDYINVTDPGVKAANRQKPFTGRVLEAVARRITGEYIKILLEQV